MINSTPEGVRSTVMSVSVCLSVRSHVSEITRSNFIFVRIACGLGSVILLRRCVKLCTSGFVDDVNSDAAIGACG